MRIILRFCRYLKLCESRMFWTSSRRSPIWAGYEDETTKRNRRGFMGTYLSRLEAQGIRYKPVVRSQGRYKTFRKQALRKS